MTLLGSIELSNFGLKMISSVWSKEKQFIISELNENWRERSSHFDQILYFQLKILIER